MEDFSQTAVNQRIKILIKEKVFSQADLARLVDVKPPTVSEHLNKEGDLPSRYLIIISKEFPNISSDWLLKGEGPMFIDKSYSSNKLSNKNISGGSTASNMVGNNQGGLTEAERIELVQLRIEIDKYKELYAVYKELYESAKQKR